MSLHLARPRDTGKAWAVDCYNAKGAWLWAHFGETPLTQRQAKTMVKDLNSTTKKKITFGASAGAK
jgi:hypothetical protein